MNKIYYVVMKVRKWENVEVEAKNFALMPGRLSKPEDGCVGFLEVFDDYKEASKCEAIPENILMMQERAEAK